MEVLDRAPLLRRAGKHPSLISAFLILAASLALVATVTVVGVQTRASYEIYFFFSLL